MLTTVFHLFRAPPRALEIISGSAVSIHNLTLYVAQMTANKDVV